MIHMIGQPNTANDIMHQRKCTDLSLQPNPEKGYSDLCHPNPISLHIPIKILRFTRIVQANKQLPINKHRKYTKTLLTFQTSIYVIKVSFLSTIPAFFFFFSGQPNRECREKQDKRDSLFQELLVYHS